MPNHNARTIWYYLDKVQISNHILVPFYKIWDSYKVWYGYEIEIQIIEKLKFIFSSCKLIPLNRDVYKTNVYVISHHLVCFILQCQYYKDACFMSMTRMFCKNVATKAKKCKRHLHLASLHTNNSCQIFCYPP